MPFAIEELPRASSPVTMGQFDVDDYGLSFVVRDERCRLP